jgi:hypothetical protein
MQPTPTRTGGRTLLIHNHAGQETSGEEVLVAATFSVVGSAEIADGNDASAHSGASGSGIGTSV